MFKQEELDPYPDLSEELDPDLEQIAPDPQHCIMAS
jgi:hypothetical protein